MLAARPRQALAANIMALVRRIAKQKRPKKKGGTSLPRPSAKYAAMRPYFFTISNFARTMTMVPISPGAMGIEASAATSAFIIIGIGG